MANIKVRDLTSITGADLFNDSESFMQDLSDDELESQGGISPSIGLVARITYTLLFTIP